MVFFDMMSYTQKTPKFGFSAAPKRRGWAIANDPILTQYGVICDRSTAEAFALPKTNF